MARGCYTVLKRGDDTHFSHHVLAVDAMDKGSYIIDLSGAQVGLEIVVMPLAAYMERYGATVQTVHDYGYTLACFKEALIEVDGGGPRSRVSGTQWKMYQAMNEAVEWFEADSQEHLSAVMHKPDDEYRDAKSRLMGRLRTACGAAFHERAAKRHPEVTARKLGIRLSKEEKALVESEDSASQDPGICSGIRWRWSQELAERKATYAGVAAGRTDSPLGVQKLAVR